MAGPEGRSLGYKYLCFKYRVLPDRLFTHAGIMNGEPCNGPQLTKHSPIVMPFQAVGNIEQHVFDEH